MEEEIKANIVYLFIVGSIAAIVLIAGIVGILILYQKRMLKNLKEKKEAEAKYQQNLLNSFIETQEKERKRIAADLHDEIGASLAAAKMLLNQKSLSEESIQETKNILEKTGLRAREISHNLMPPSLEKVGLFKVLERFFNNLNSAKTTVNYNYEENLQLSDKEQLALYRIAQELANNTIKYANASRIEVAITKEGNSIQFNYSDNGKGYDQTNKQGMGLNNIESRTQSIKGSIEFFSIPNSSTGVKISIPNHGKN